MIDVPEWLSHEISLMLPADPGAGAWYECSRRDWGSGRFRRHDMDALRAAESTGAEHCTTIATEGASAHDAALVGSLDLLRMIANRIDGGAVATSPRPDGVPYPEYEKCDRDCGRMAKFRVLDDRDYEQAVCCEECAPLYVPRFEASGGAVWLPTPAEGSAP